MKVLNINSEYYLFPASNTNFDDFAIMLSEEKDKFIKLRRLNESECVHPYYVLEEIKDVYVRVDSIDEFFEEEIVILTREEYDKLLKNIQNKLCKKCEERDCCEDYKDKLCLDGKCPEFCEE